MKINSSHLIGAAIALAAVFFSKLDAQDAPNKAEPQKWEYAELYRFMNKNPSKDLPKPQALQLPEGNFPKDNETTLPYGLSSEWRSWKGDLNEVKNKLGEYGWELCYEVEWENINGTYFRIYFKRPKH